MRETAGGTADTRMHATLVVPDVALLAVQESLLSGARRLDGAAGEARASGDSCGGAPDAAPGGPGEGLLFSPGSAPAGGQGRGSSPVPGAAPAAGQQGWGGRAPAPQGPRAGWGGPGRPRGGPAAAARPPDGA